MQRGMYNDFLKYDPLNLYISGLLEWIRYLNP